MEKNLKNFFKVIANESDILLMSKKYVIPDCGAIGFGVSFSDIKSTFNGKPFDSENYKYPTAIFESSDDFLSSLTVSVDDGNSGSASAAITINVNDVDENQDPIISEQTFTIDENSSNGTTVCNTPQKSDHWLS